MEALIPIIFIGIVIFAIYIIIPSKKKQPSPEPEKKPPLYTYESKSSILTKVEREFYAMLQQALGSEYTVVPQAHISSFLSHKVKGQNWKGAFARINGKSVDFLICEKATLRPLCAVELDDYTHQRADRIERDEFVTTILQASRFPFVRYAAGEWSSPEAIRAKLNQS